ncbi:MAG TPA: DUF3466 family protein [Bryobacteraceae bacterium]|jgi:probable HAF family extracellular repeat protein|nr:DUF3466 family protein [Bryobacteraceae bacterium]
MRRLLFLAILPAVASATAITSVDNLGSLGSGESVAYGINVSGLAVGWSTNSDGITNAFGANGPGSLFDFSALASGAESYAYGVNSAGAVAGVFYENGESHGAIWTAGGGMADLGPGSIATTINDSGVAAGGNGQAFIYANGEIRQLGTLAGGNWSAAYAVNEGGDVVGYGNTGSGAFRGFYWTGTTLISIGTLGGDNSYAMDINDSGQIVGDASTSSGYLHAFSTTGGAMQDLGTLGGTSSFAYGVNNSGLVVGYSTTSDGGTHAFLYENGEMVDLNSLLPDGSGWVLLQAYGINDQNQIVGTGLWNGEERAFRVNLDTGSPVPEPGVCILVACGGVLLSLGSWLRRRSEPAANQEEFPPK